MDKKIIKFDDIEIEEYEFHQPKKPILIHNIDINKIVVSNKLPFTKQYFKYLTDYKDDKKSGLYAYFIQKWVYVEEILIKPKACTF